MSEIFYLNNFCLKKIHVKIWGNKWTHTFILLVKAYIGVTLEVNLVISIRRKIYISMSLDLPVIILGSYSLLTLTPHESVDN